MQSKSSFDANPPGTDRAGDKMNTLDLGRAIASDAVRAFDANPQSEELRQEARRSGAVLARMQKEKEIEAFGGVDAYHAAMTERELRSLTQAVKEAETRLDAYREHNYMQSSCAQQKTHEEIIREAEQDLARVIANLAAAESG
jgi:capsule polysaccharide export protein KpsE/RkpR